VPGRSYNRRVAVQEYPFTSTGLAANQREKKAAISAVWEIANVMVRELLIMPLTP